MILYEIKNADEHLKRLERAEELIQELKKIILWDLTVKVKVEEKEPSTEADGSNN